MKLGIGLPNTMAHETDRRLMLEWARLAEEAGFHELGTIDKPNYDSWDPLATLAGVAGVTERIRLATTILQLPPRNRLPADPTPGTGGAARREGATSLRPRRREDSGAGKRSRRRDDREEADDDDEHAHPSSVGAPCEGFLIVVLTVR
jgi:Luciferase-like monooxygenase